MTLTWTNGDKPAELTALSKSRTDQDDPVYYILRYCPGRRLWRVSFAGHQIIEGSLAECMLAGEDADTAGRPCL